ncbi:MAG: 23S rRNA (adenine(2503)-C(2))-methyltransferase RlmN [Ruminococcaceae bacterium]|nr:23S rRNA (adenine(2503)-C(2))-methyltransferase RlmN [Oscillospiraceae bacterium]
MYNSQNKPDIMSMTPEELEGFVESIGEKKFRAAQLFSWMAKGTPIDEMSNLSKSFREKLKSEADYRLPKIEKKLVSAIDGTIKYLMALEDGECVESVFMHYEHGTSLCVSSQAGCAMGCKFCASTLRGKMRNLTASEILGQAAAVSYDTGERVDGIVMMGIGEPLDNYDNVIRFLKLVSDERGMGIGLRHISLSTCGLVPKIYDLAEEGLPVTLSVSLHAADDETRDALMPVNKKYNIAKLLEACRAYFLKTGRRVSFEYTLISGKNDTKEDAVHLASVIKKGMRAPCHVNLIMLNEVAETGLKTTDRARARAFAEELQKNGVNATIRRRLGSDINASCGQLRLQKLENE